MRMNRVPRYIIRTILFLLISINCSALGSKISDGIYILERGVTLEITDSKFIIDYAFDDWLLPKINGVYQVLDLEEQSIISVSFEDQDFNFSYLYSNEKIILFLLDSNLVFFGSKEIAKGGDSIFTYFHRFDSSSFFEEEYGGKTYLYKPENLSSWDLSTPWVEGVEGNGRGEWIDFHSATPTRSIWIINGFYDPDRPYLFYKNNRIKKMKVYAYEKDGDRLVHKYDNFFILQDGILLSEILLPEAWDYFRIEIVETYDGSMYDDTCLTGLFTDTRLGY